MEPSATASPPSGLAVNPKPASGLPPFLAHLYTQLLKYQSNPHVYYRINPAVGNVEYLIANDLAPGLPTSNPPIERARRFLKDEAQLFGLDEQWVDQILFLKHHLNSYMGNHYIFGLRAVDSTNQEETLNSSLVFHFDPFERLVMVAGTYHPHMGTKRLTMEVKLYETELRATGLAVGIGFAWSATACAIAASK